MKKSSAVRIQDWVKCPPLSLENLNDLQRVTGPLVTKYFDDKDKLNGFKSSLIGSFKFGTLQGYKPQEDELSEENSKDSSLDGRFGDREEGATSDIYKSNTNEINEISFRNVSIGGIKSTNSQLEIEYLANDFCACLSKGDYSKEQARALQVNGNPRICAYIVYSLPDLIYAVQATAKELDKTKSHSVLCRGVEYRSKNQHWDVTEGFQLASNRDQIDYWLDAAFVKDQHSFQHENETRLLLVNPSRPSSLRMHTPSLYLGPDIRIARCILRYGTFDPMG